MKRFEDDDDDYHDDDDDDDGDGDDDDDDDDDADDDDDGDGDDDDDDDDNDDVDDDDDDADDDDDGDMNLYSQGRRHNFKNGGGVQILQRVKRAEKFWGLFRMSELPEVLLFQLRQVKVKVNVDLYSALS